MKPGPLLLLLLALQSANAGELSRNQWGDLFVAAAESDMCAEATYFRQCVTPALAQCQHAIVAAARSCLADNASRLPLTFTSKQQSQDAGALIGQCVGRTMDASSSSATPANPRCRDPNAWKH